MNYLVFIVALLFSTIAIAQEENKVPAPKQPRAPKIPVPFSKPPVVEDQPVQNCNEIEANFTGTCVINHYGSPIIARKEEYVKGAITRRFLYNSKGSLRYEAHYDADNQWTMRSIDYGDSFIIRLTLNEGTGTWKRYLHDGTLLIDGSMKDGQFTGYWKRYKDGVAVDSVFSEDYNRELNFVDQLNYHATRIDARLYKVYLNEENAKNGAIEIAYPDPGEIDEEMEVVMPVPPPPAPAVVVKAEIIDFPDVDAQFPGGADSMRAYIARTVIYPETSLQKEEQGKVYVSFVVEKDGSLTNIKVIRSASRDLDQEAKRVIRTMPKWTPGESNGKPVRTMVRLPIVFSLD